MDKYMSGDLPKEKFLSKKQKLDEASSALTAEIAELGNKLEVIWTSEVPETEKLVGEMKKYSKESQLMNSIMPQPRPIRNCSVTIRLQFFWD